MSRLIRYFAVGVVGLLAIASIGGTASLARFEPDGSADVPAEVVTTLTDDAVDESSGLVVRGDLLFTVNDSGDGPHVYAMDRVSGELTDVSTYDDEDPFDVEAIAPGRGDALWVGDIGDNQRVRGSIRLHRFVRPATGGAERAETYELSYPDGPHDAETLLIHPRTERALVVTKRPLIGGVVFRAPRRLRDGGMHRLEQVAAVPGFVTDGAFFPDGHHVVLRTYGTAGVYTYPGIEPVGEQFDLPLQDQGEGIAVGEDGRLYLSSENVPNDVLAVEVPDEVASAMDARGETEAPADPDPDSTDPAPEAADAVDEDGAGDAAGDGTRPDLGQPQVYLLAAAVGAGVVALLVRAARRRGRRTR